MTPLDQLKSDRMRLLSCLLVLLGLLEKDKNIPKPTLAKARKLCDEIGKR